MSDEVPGKHWQEPGGLHVDVRGLPPPDPMYAILWHVGRPGQKGPITVHLDRYPVHLIPELDDRGWRHETVSDTPGDVCLILRSER